MKRPRHRPVSLGSASSPRPRGERERRHPEGQDHSLQPLTTPGHRQPPADEYSQPWAQTPEDDKGLGRNVVERTSPVWTDQSHVRLRTSAPRQQRWYFAAVNGALAATALGLCCR